MIRAIIVDDEPLTRERVRTLALDAGDIDVVGEARNGLEALDLIARVQPELVFLDVEMPELDGFGVVATLDAESAPAVVFITAFEQYALKAFDAGVIDFLHKPITRTRFAAAVSRARARIGANSSTEWKALVQSAQAAQRARGFRERYVVRRGATHYFLPVGEITWIDAADNYLNLHAAGRTHLVRGTMKQAEEELDPAHFIRVHRSAIVASASVTSVTMLDSGGFMIALRDGSSIRGSRQYAARIRSLLA
jgi:two-component system LytT family response regulator